MSDLIAARHGVFEDMANEVYHSGREISKSGVDVGMLSMLHYYERFLKEGREPKESTPQQGIGIAGHCKVLEPKRFPLTYFRAPLDERRGTKKWNEAQAANPGKIPLKPEEWDLIEAIDKAVSRHPAASLLLGKEGRAECSVFFNDPVTGLPCKCRPDYWTSDGIVIDLKTTMCAAPGAFRRQAFDYKFHISAAMTLNGIEAATGERPWSYVFVAVEKDPVCVAVYAADEDFIQAGQRALNEILPKFKECFDTNVWPGYPTTIETLSLPEWVKNRF